MNLIVAVKRERCSQVTIDDCILRILLARLKGVEGMEGGQGNIMAIIVKDETAIPAIEQLIGEDCHIEKHGPC